MRALSKVATLRRMAPRRTRTRAAVRRCLGRRREAVVRRRRRSPRRDLADRRGDGAAARRLSPAAGPRRADARSAMRLRPWRRPSDIRSSPSSARAISLHKSDIGGVITSLRTATEVRDAVSRLLADGAVHDIHPEGVLDSADGHRRRRDHGRPGARSAVRPGRRIRSRRHGRRARARRALPRRPRLRSGRGRPHPREPRVTASDRLPRTAGRPISPRSRTSCSDSRSSLRTCRKCARSTSIR